MGFGGQFSGRGARGLVRSIGVLLVLLCQLVAISAGAADFPRRIVMDDGAVFVGWLIEQGERHLVLRAADGTDVDLPLARVRSVEVLAQGGASEIPDEASTIREGFDGFAARQGEQTAPLPVDPVAARKAKTGRVLTVVPAMPLIGIGAGLTLFSSVGSLGPRESVRAPAVLGLGLTAVGLIVAGAGGAIALEANAGGGTHAQTLFGFGVGFSITGLVASGISSVVLPRSDDMSRLLIGGPIGLGLTAVGLVVGSLSFVLSATSSHKRILTPRPLALTPPVPWLAPRDGGLQAGLAFAW